MSTFTTASRRALRSATGMPATPQQMVTTKGFLDRKIVAERIRGSSDSRDSGQRYDGGGILEHHTILPHDVTIGRRRQTHVKTLYNHPNIHCLASFNGERFADVPTDGHLQRLYRFTGVALQKEQYDGNRADSGLAMVTSGVYTVNNSGTQELAAGMIVCWRVPATNRGIRGAAPLSRLPGDVYNVGEQSRGRLPPVITEYKPRDPIQILRASHATVFRDSSLGQDQAPGIVGRTLRDYYRTGMSRDRKLRYLTHHQDDAMGLKFGFIPMALAMIYGLIRAGKLKSADGRSDAAGALREIISWSGLYRANPSEQQLDNQRLMLAYPMWKHNSDPVVVDAVTQQFSADFRAGFRTGTNTPSGNFTSINGTLVQNLHDAPSILFGSIIGSYHEDRESILGMAQNNALPGEGVTINFGASV